MSDRRSTVSSHEAGGRGRNWHRRFPARHGRAVGHRLVANAPRGQPEHRRRGIPPRSFDRQDGRSDARGVPSRERCYRSWTIAWQRHRAARSFARTMLQPWTPLWSDAAEDRCARQHCPGVGDASVGTHRPSGRQPAPDTTHIEADALTRVVSPRGRGSRGHLAPPFPGVRYALDTTGTHFRVVLGIQIESARHREQDMVVAGDTI